MCSTAFQCCLPGLARYWLTAPTAAAQNSIDQTANSTSVGNRGHFLFFFIIFVAHLVAEFDSCDHRSADQPAGVHLVLFQQFFVVGCLGEAQNAL